MKTLAGFAALLTLLLAGLAPAAAAERIVSFVSDVVVEREGDLSVTETIDVEAEGESIRHGIFRDFPTRYRLPDGAAADVGFHLERVTRDGVAEDSVLERIENGVRIRIGKADNFVTQGRHSFEIRYRTTRQIGIFADHDELYWNVTGSGWMFPIDRAEAQITLPEKVPFRRTAFYTGARGDRGKDASIVEEEPGRIVFRTTRALPAHNGLTVVAAWRKGVVEPPAGALQARQWLLDNPGLGIMFAGFPAILAYYAFAWTRVGRDPPAGLIIPLFGPPDGLTPAATRYIERMTFDDGCFAAAIVDLGVKGHLKSSRKAASQGSRAAPATSRCRWRSGRSSTGFSPGVRRCCSSRTTTPSSPRRAKAKRNSFRRPISAAFSATTISGRRPASSWRWRW